MIALVPALPLLGCILNALLNRRGSRVVAGTIASVAVGAAAVISFAVTAQLLGGHEPFQSTLWTWMSTGNVHVDIGLRVDPLAAAMMCIITGIGFLIHVYSIGYMDDPADAKSTWRFFCYLNLFVFAMLLLVMGDSFPLMFVGWEGVGLCSYLLIGFWYENTDYAAAGKKAFVTNRIGDFSFVIGLFWLFWAVGPESLNFHTLEETVTAHPELVGGVGGTAVTAICLLFFGGATGKSAQIPLYVWLPDAMAGPTPVSALIHAATMVTAGVYLMTRINPVLAAATEASTVIAIVGAATAFIAATIAVAQNDIKRVLAYSTVSQLGYMFLAVGCGAYVAAVFHMVTHAFFKALLFLGSGSVIHGLHDEQDMRRMGALRFVMPITAITFIVGWLAIAGVPPFAGFWSKDEILLFAYDKSPVLWFVGLVTALLTAYYMTRQVVMVFFGEAQWKEARPAPQAVGAAVNREHAVQPHESGWLMLLPLVVLAILSVIGGALQLPFDGLHFLEDWLHPVVEEGERVLAAGTEDIKWLLAAVAAAVAIVGIIVGWLVYERKRARAIEPAVLAHAWYYDESISRFAGGPGRASFEGTSWFDANVVDGAVDGVGRFFRGLGGQLRKLQTGYVRSYALGVGLGAVALLAWFLYRGLA